MRAVRGVVSLFQSSRVHHIASTTRAEREAHPYAHACIERVKYLATQTANVRACKKSLHTLSPRLNSRRDSYKIRSVRGRRCAAFWAARAECVFLLWCRCGDRRARRRCGGAFHVKSITQHTCNSRFSHLRAIVCTCLHAVHKRIEQAD